MKVHEYTNRH